MLLLISPYTPVPFDPVASPFKPAEFKTSPAETPFFSLYATVYKWFIPPVGIDKQEFKHQEFFNSFSIKVLTNATSEMVQVKPEDNMPINVIYAKSMDGTEKDSDYFHAVKVTDQGFIDFSNVI